MPPCGLTMRLETPRLPDSAVASRSSSCASRWRQCLPAGVPYFASCYKRLQQWLRGTCYLSCCWLAVAARFRWTTSDVVLRAAVAPLKIMALSCVEVASISTGSHFIRLNEQVQPAFGRPTPHISFNATSSKVPYSFWLSYLVLPNGPVRRTSSAASSGGPS